MKIRVVTKKWWNIEHRSLDREADITTTSWYEWEKLVHDFSRRPGELTLLHGGGFQYITTNGSVVHFIPAYTVMAAKDMTADELLAARDFWLRHAEKCELENKPLAAMLALRKAETFENDLELVQE
ncbi:hypothetical protein SEA_JUMBO_90 [Gordonia phage Jumbo]|uniref:Uncharacterized protein n=1 Tax=Gordonia phage Jumbo TaxID=1887650 RepID=A0A1B3B0Y1_9CAUD|nr:hypothetical protein BIZ69_gp090 [Gordonia phage Jumbo]AOE44598.1 hypothetical protein SEA_JUMBO_90 [Gordonia phage Jumbo]